MGRYKTAPVSENTLKDIIEAVSTGYTDNNGVIHRPNKQIATILTLQANLGCRIGDICNLKVENIVWDGSAWRLDLTEQKTGKKRLFIVPTPVKQYIDKWTKSKRIKSGNLFTIKEPAVWKQMRAVSNYLDLQNVSCHSIRKAAAIRVYETSGKDIALTSAFLNHSDTKTTAIYLQRPSKQMDDIISKSSVLL